MSQLVNIWLAVPEALATQFADNYVRIIETSEPHQPKFWKRNDFSSPEWRAAFRPHDIFFMKVPSAGPLANRVVLSIYVNMIRDSNAQVLALEELETALGAAGIILGAWIKDGLQYGQSRTREEKDYTDPDNPVLVTPSEIIGEPVFPIHPNIMDVMPDDYLIDEDTGLPIPGTETPASAPKDVILQAGWKPRSFT